MTNTIKVSDVSVEKAIQKGLRQLGLPQDQVFVEIISEGKKGLFGFGQKNAEVELTPVATMVSQEETEEEVLEPVVETVEKTTVETVEAAAVVEEADSCCQAKDSCATACDKKADCAEKKECCNKK